MFHPFQHLNQLPILKVKYYIRFYSQGIEYKAHLKPQHGIEILFMVPCVLMALTAKGDPIIQVPPHRITPTENMVGIRSGIATPVILTSVLVALFDFDCPKVV
jgi:hypothetical protein